MTAVEFSRLTRGTGPHHAHGWTVSLLCHMLGVGGALLLMAEIERPVLPTPFHWEVAMVETPASVEPARAPVQPAPTPAPKRPVERVMEPRPLVKPLVKPIVPIQQAVRDVAAPIDAMVESRPLVDAVEPIQQAVRDVATPIEAIVESRPLVNAVEPVQQTVREVAAPVESVMERPAVQTTESRTVLAQAVSSSQGPVIEQAASQPTVSSIVERAEPVEGRTTVESFPQARQIEVVERESASTESVSSTIEHRVVQQRRVRYRQTQADYGWLRDALWSRIEKLKRYPAQAKINHWEGKVVVEAVIRDDGVVVGLKVAESC